MFAQRTPTQRVTHSREARMIAFGSSIRLGSSTLHQTRTSHPKTKVTNHPSFSHAAFDHVVQVSLNTIECWFDSP